MGKAVRLAFRASVPIMLGYLCIGIAYGLLFVGAGFPAWLAVVSSVLIYAGAMQFIAIDFLVVGVGVLEMFVVTLVANLRHIFYGLSMIDLYRDEKKRRPYLIFALTDETYSLLCTGQTPEGVNPSDYRFFVSLFDHLYWVAGSLIGAVAGGIITVDTTGMDFAMTALFLVICVEQWLAFPSHLPAGVGALCGLVFLLMLGPSRFMIPGLVAATGVLLLLRPRLQAVLERQGKEGEEP